jgi:Protein of unknown function (DUF664)
MTHEDFAPLTEREAICGFLDLQRVALVRKVAGVDDRNLRWVLLHMIEETARHTGHADIIRETLDGSRGI